MVTHGSQNRLCRSAQRRTPAKVLLHGLHELGCWATKYTGRARAIFQRWNWLTGLQTSTSCREGSVTHSKPCNLHHHAALNPFQDSCSAPQTAQPRPLMPPAVAPWRMALLCRSPAPAPPLLPSHQLAQAPAAALQPQRRHPPRLAPAAADLQPPPAPAGPAAIPAAAAGPAGSSSITPDWVHARLIEHITR